MIKMMISVLIILILFSPISNAWSISIPKASIPVDSQNPIKPDKGGTADEAHQASGASGGGYETSSGPDDSVVVNQIMLPIKSDGYLSGQAARIFVEIKNNKKFISSRDLKGLAVRVIVDDELNVLPDSARWLKVYSLEDLCDIKSEIYNCPLDKYPETDDYNKFPINMLSEYNLFRYNRSTVNNSEELKYIYNRLYNLYDINWIKKKDVKFYTYNYGIWINNSENKSYVWIQNRNCSAKMDLSDGRSYDIKNKNSNNIYYINYTNSVIGFGSDGLSPKESIIFYYDIKPRKTGIFNTEILVRAYDSDLSHLQDLSHISKVEVKQANPEFKVNPRPAVVELYKYDDKILNIFGLHPYIDVFYDITYTGGASETFCDNISISFDDPSAECFYVDEDGIRNDTLSKRSNFIDHSYFNKYDTQSIHLRVASSSKGNHPLPGITIEDVHYSFIDQKINVDTWFYRHLDIIVLLISSLSLIITAAELYAAKRDIKELAKIMVSRSGYQRALKSRRGYRRALKRDAGIKEKLGRNPEVIAVFVIIILFIVLLFIN